MLCEGSVVLPGRVRYSGDTVWVGYSLWYRWDTVSTGGYRWVG